MFIIKLVLVLTQESKYYFSSCSVDYCCIIADCIGVRTHAYTHARTCSIQVHRSDVMYLDQRESMLNSHVNRSG